MTIAEFLESRIAEDEALANAALVDVHYGFILTPYEYGNRVLGNERDSTEKQDQFIVNWWPARVLAECAAKRAIVAEHKPDWAGPVCVRCRFIGGYVEFPCPTIRALAAIHRDHPDYRSEWAV